MNSYLKNKLSNQLKILPELKEDLHTEAELMDRIGVASEEDHKRFHYILLYTRKIAEELVGKKLSKEAISHVSQIIFQDQLPIYSIFSFYHSVSQGLKKIGMQPMKKTAYPIGANDLLINNPYNIKKWMKAIQDIYQLAQINRIDVSQALNIVTEHWDNMEKRDFQHWLAFYQENAHQKYKTAFDGKYYQGDGVTIPLDVLKAKLPPDMNSYESQPVDKKQEVEKKVKAIIGRLNAAERLSTDPEVQRTLQKMLDGGLAKWLEDLQRIKRLVQTAPLRAIAAWDRLNVLEISEEVSDDIVRDLIVREAHVLAKQGKKQSAQIMYRIAQAVPGLTPLPGGEGVPGTDDDGAVQELIEGMNHEPKDSNEVVDVEDDPIAAIHIQAQAAPPQTTPMPASEAPAEIAPETPHPEVKQVKEDPFDVALSHVTVTDVIIRLEALANIFRNREISRQLALIDLMMDQLGIATYFPSLAEANSKSLESNQYALTRVEDILSKLRGSVEIPGHEVELHGEPRPVEPIPANISPEQIKQNLTQEEAVEKVRKDKRKEQEQQKAMAPEPITNVPEELNGPVQIAPTPEAKS